MLNIKNLFGANKKSVIGKLETISITNLGLHNITAKIDTGAYRGTIHAENIREIENDDGEKVLEFAVLDKSHPEFQNKIHRVKKYGKTRVRSSQTDYQDRYVIPVDIQIGGKKIKSEFTLSNRKELRNAVLIGRKALRNKFLVDVNKTV